MLRTLIVFLLPTGVFGQAQFQFTTFTIPGALTGEGSDIDNPGRVVGHFTTPAGDTRGFQRETDGSLTYLTAPGDLGNPFDTRANGLTFNGRVVGTFYDTAHQTNSGFLYANGQYFTFNAPRQPPHAGTVLNALNERGDFCGYVQAPPQFNATAFASENSQVFYFNFPGAISTTCNAVNNEGLIAGTYVDRHGVSHGFTRTQAGLFQAIDLAAATTVVQQVLCTPEGNLQAGTEIRGLNDQGVISGHYFVPADQPGLNATHAFERLVNGTVWVIDVPGALQTSGGGGINSFGQIAGHYDLDSTCREALYIATPATRP